MRTNWNTPGRLLPCWYLLGAASLMCGRPEGATAFPDRHVAGREAAGERAKSLSPLIRPAAPPRRGPPPDASVTAREPPQRAAGFYDPRTYDWAIGSSHSRAVRRRFYAAQTGWPGARVLELGCGTGDICLAIARRGAHVVGLDNSPEMIRAAQDKARRQGCARARWVQGRMEAFVLPDHFTAVIVPYHALFHVLSRVQLRDLLARVYDHLQPGGVLLADVLTRRPDEPARRSATTRTRTPDGIYQVHEDEHFDPSSGRLHTRFAYELEHPEDGQVLDTWTRHLDYLLIDPDDLARLLREAGFTDVAHFAAFAPGEPFAAGQDAVVRAVRPSTASG